eukprot:753516-Hanusia_phi.AAC.1
MAKMGWVVRPYRTVRAQRVGGYYGFLVTGLRRYKAVTSADLPAVTTAGKSAESSKNCPRPISTISCWCRAAQWQILSTQSGRRSRHRRNGDSGTP